jgi:hypothetical protein
MSLIEVWIDQAERRTWFLAEIVREQTLPQESRALSEEDVFGVAIFSGKA